MSDSHPTDNMSYTTQDEIKLSPSGETALLIHKSKGFAWYNLPDQQLLYRQESNEGLDLLGFSGEGINWIQGGAKIEAHGPNGESNSAALPLTDQRWRCLTVSEHSGQLTGIQYFSKMSKLRVFDWPNPKEALAEIEIPKYDDYQLMVSPDGSLIYLKGQNRSSSNAWEAIFGLSQNAVEPGQVLQKIHELPAGLRSLPSLTNGKLAWALPKGKIELYSPNRKLNIISGEDRLGPPSELSFCDQGRKLLSVGVLGYSEEGQTDWLIRLIQVDNGLELEKKELRTANQDVFFIHEGESLYRLYLGESGRVKTELLSWR